MKSLTRRILFAIPLPGLLATRTAMAAAGGLGRPKSPGESWLRTELYFGTGKPDNTVVTDAQFQAFIDTQVTPRFPDGLTLLSGYGQFRNSQGVIKQEKSFLLILFYPPHIKEATKLIEEIRETYKGMFQQESVLRSDSVNQISF